MDAVSKFWQTEDTLKQMTKKTLGEQLYSFSAKPLDGGFCNAVYLITANDKDMVLKIAPQENIEMLSDEKNLLLNEALMHSPLLLLPTKQYIYTIVQSRIT